MGIGGRLAVVPFGGLLISIRKAKNTGFSSRWTADLLPDRQAFSGDTTRSEDRGQRQHINWPGVVQHLEFPRPSSIWVRQIGNRERRNGGSRSDHEVYGIESARNGVANLVELVPALQVRRHCDICAGANSLDRGCLVLIVKIRTFRRRCNGTPNAT